MRMIMRDLLPVYEKYQSELVKSEENWTNNLVDFTFNWIVTKFGAEVAKEYLESIEELDRESK